MFSTINTLFLLALEALIWYLSFLVASMIRTVSNLTKESSRPICQGFKVIDTYTDEWTSRGQTKPSPNVPCSIAINHNMASSGGTTRVQYFEPLGFQSQKVLYQQTHTLMGGTHAMNGPYSECFT